MPTFAVQMTWPGSAGADLCLFLGASALCVAVWLGCRQHAGPARRAWLFIGLGLAAWLIGDILYLVAPATPDTAGLSLPDVAWLLGYPAMSAGVVQMVRQRAPGHLREGLLDCLVMVTAAAVAAWQLLVVPQAAVARPPAC